MSEGIDSLEKLVRFYADHGVSDVYVKLLAPNDNSKNQVYFGPGFEALTLFPLGEIAPSETTSDPIFKADTNFFWIGDDLSLVPAPTAQVILYPQYPEIRFSGFLKGIDRTRATSVRELMASRDEGRVFFIGADNSGRLIGSVFGLDARIAQETKLILPTLDRATEIFYALVCTEFLGTSLDSRTMLFRELDRIHKLEWIDSKRLDGDGILVPCVASQCGGYTLEAELGIRTNALSEPDFMGWEVKQHGSLVVTLMTPQPTDGFYVENGVGQFVRTFGYPDKRGREDRLNFGGVHRCNIRHATTKLTMRLEGYDTSKTQITNANGGISLVADDGTVAISWSFTSILTHWNRKHRMAVYVPSKHRTEPGNQYSYSSSVRTGIGTDALHLLKAIDTGIVYYDPGIKLEHASTSKPTTKTRSQFRMNLKNLNALYDTVAQIDISNPG